MLHRHVAEIADLEHLLVVTRADDREADLVLRALVGIAGRETLAGRVVLQRILPGLIACGARYRSSRDGIDPLEHAVAAAWLAIVQFDTTRRHGPIAPSLISDAIDTAFRRPLRRLASNETFRPPHVFDRAFAPDGPTNGHDELIAVLRSARANGVDRADVELLGTIARDGTTRHLAERNDVTPRTMRNRRDAAIDRVRQALALAA